MDNSFLGLKTYDRPVESSRSIFIKKNEKLSFKKRIKGKNVEYIF